MDNTTFKTLDAAGKIKELASRVRKTLMDGGKITSAFYLFDQNDKLHVMEVNENFLLKPDNVSILRQIVREKIKELKTRGLSVEKLLFMREGFYSKDHPDKMEMNLDSDFNKSNANEAFIVSVEDDFDYTLSIYDMITIESDGETFTVMSENPIEELKYCKIDPKNNLKSNYCNLL